ncbi:dephospho-CoA kinase [Sagittula stellata]|uniref:Dephospho-CoA kinase n=1 Tax=Sagittula stellata (strain ATCC 700073 / DSM 11524 / E-37) TaxID=388399 RepID=A3K2Y3_SAGS3|nr:dephospho-CoA kinase [Sagittula stellata]EBA08542.1 dephospho-CoA kinase [Sagittula stellata E-37]
MRFKLGLTGSIGMGKSSTAAIFAAEDCAVWDADAAVHRLYSAGGAAVGPISARFPEAVQNGKVSRDVLKTIIGSDPEALPDLERIVHPLVQADREIFVRDNADKIGVFDIPLLFETGGDAEMDATACVFVSREIQRERVLARGTMTEADLQRILARQLPSEEKCARSTWTIETDTPEHAREQVLRILNEIEERLTDA